VSFAAQLEQVEPERTTPYKEDIVEQPQPTENVKMKSAGALGLEKGPEDEVSSGAAAIVALKDVTLVEKGGKKRKRSNSSTSLDTLDTKQPSSLPCHIEEE
jgi:hypothetical protein